jgi:hypothetical protein
MKIVRKKLEVASLVLVSGLLGQSALGQTFGQTQPQQQGGLGAGTGTGNPSALGLGDITFANNDGTFQNGTPGSFGGPGISGAPLIEFATKNATQGFSPNGTPTGSTSGGNRTGGVNQSPFGANAFGSNTAANRTTGGQGGNNGAGGLGGPGNLGGLGNLGGFGRGFGNNNAASSNQKKNKIRPTVKPDIEFEARTSESIAAGLKTRFTKIPLPARVRGATASLEGNTVVLTGEVSSESDKRLVERLVKLEPGVNLVQNDLTIRPSSKQESVQPAPVR